MRPTLLAFDFFCGAGGTTRGFVDAGAYVLAGVDKDPTLEQTYILNNAQVLAGNRRPEFLCADLLPRTSEHPCGNQADVRAFLQDRLSAARREYSDLPLLFGISAPCQPFTKLARKSLTETRLEYRSRDASLLLESAKFVEWLRPDIIFVENVVGIRNAKYGPMWDLFADRLRDSGYAVGSATVCASNFGVPQHRRRSIMLAVKRTRLVVPGDDLIVPTKDPASRSLTVREAIGHLPPIGAGEAHPRVPNHRTRTLSLLNQRRISAVAPGESNRVLATSRFGNLSLDCHNEAVDRLQTPCFSDVYTRMDPDRPSPTITTKCHSISNGRFGHFEPGQVRGISLREAACLQSFPEDYVFYPTHMLDPVARMIGNAVPPRLAAFFARYLLSLVKV